MIVPIGNTVVSCGLEVRCFWIVGGVATLRTVVGDTLCRRWEVEQNTRGVVIGSGDVVLVAGLNVGGVGDRWVSRRRIHLCSSVP